ncbi:MAG: hypothetical protein JNK85_28205 [Verrucomicrobiales bacterium]|nr:hypothetical protein [Verrucomicrobiales bacterium]
MVGLVVDVLLRRTNAKRNADFQERHQKVVARSRRALLALAARTMEQETGQAPISPNQLVPTVLRAVPTDPATGAAFDRLPPNGE